MSQSNLRAREAGDLFLDSQAGLRIDGARLIDTLERLGEIGADPAGGVTRLGLSPEEDAARTFLGDRYAAAGLEAETDPAGNLFVRRPGTSRGKPVLLVGSHVDTVVQGGRLDGAYGVVAALETLRVLHEHRVELPVEMVVVAFANEEGALVQTPFWGSRMLCGSLDDPLGATDRSGRPVGAHLAATGCAPDRLADVAWPPGSVAAFIELHIEQGPSLERQGVPIGVVEGIVGRTILDVDVTGEAQHAGTTPMADRRDALTAAAEIVLAVRRIAAEDRVCATATTGFVAAAPNVTNTIPGAVRLSVEVRDTDRARQARGEGVVREQCARVAASSGCRIEVTATMRSRPVSTAPFLRGVIRQAADRLGLPHLTMPSGAGHDAQIVARIAPVGMIFVPSRRGISHAPGEDTAPGDLVNGANVLLHTVLAAQAELDRHDSSPG
ncbi:Zn-dependent hydrolase [Paractinoplanes brasiliensis]|uniref:N-carbamoyl-L-amino-acid hydrolase n=1 Tax=Paractinoplanes brasiliensis TaxID=52695 RepID=A0A4R6JN03_9ACTN|nr:Zn-dependent hydrolase [Actinoplanes brasiliensis]TDO36751.1 N-carbamoyl-L-amino-acid hydrolase [Actinoplanes brasiliensis]GID32389.1 Zn-dependent hydrolase [Actinoplanes brasiliensis]